MTTTPRFGDSALRQAATTQVVLEASRSPLRSPGACRGRRTEDRDARQEAAVRPHVMTR
jgi:hypothetical protein